MEKKLKSLKLSQRKEREKMAKKYVWLKLKKDFLRQKNIKKLRKMPGGSDYVLIYLGMQLLSLENEGKLYFEGTEENFAEQMALELDENVDAVKMTIMFLEKHNLIEFGEEQDEYILPEVIGSIGSETATAERMRKMRERKKKLVCNNVTHQLQCVTNSYTEREKEREKEIEKEIEEDEEKKTLSHTHSDEFKQKYSNFLKQVATATSTTFHYVKQALNHSMIISQFDKYIEEFEKSDFLQGKKENKPVIKNFNSIDRVLSGAYRNYSKKAEIDVENYYSDDNDIDDIL